MIIFKRVINFLKYIQAMCCDGVELGEIFTRNITVGIFLKPPFNFDKTTLILVARYLFCSKAS